MHDFLDLTGQTFGRLTVERYAGRIQHRPTWQCMCSCGTRTLVRSTDLITGHKKSCGCLYRDHTRDMGKANIRHGHAMRGHLTPEYRTWQGIIKRCENPTEISYRYYGAKGVRVCRRWRRSFEAFFADMGKRPSVTHSIHRLRNDRGYCPSNCVWATRWDQARHKRTTKLTQAKVNAIRARYKNGGIMQSELGEQYGIARSTVSHVITGRLWPTLSPKKPSGSVKPARVEVA